MPLGEPIEEYKILNENMRWFSNVRFAQLTLLIAISVGLFTIVFTSKPPLSHIAAIILKAAGILTILAFWMLEELAADYWRHFRRRAEELEKELGYKQYSTVRHHRINSTNMFRVLFVALLMYG